MARSIDRWRFKYIAEFGNFAATELPNGTYVENENNFVAEFTRRVARYKVTPGLTDKASGTDEKTDMVLISNKLPNDEISEFLDLNDYMVKFCGKFYKIKKIEEDTVRVLGQHMIYLQRWEGNGKQPHPGRN